MKKIMINACLVLCLVVSFFLLTPSCSEAGQEVKRVKMLPRVNGKINPILIEQKNKAEAEKKAGQGAQELPSIDKTERKKVTRTLKEDSAERQPPKLPAAPVRGKTIKRQ
jgi:hypothetical protein